MGDVVTACLDARREVSGFDGAPQGALRVLIADAIASIRAQDGLNGVETDYDSAACRALVGLGRSLSGGPCLADELDMLVVRYS